jgi:alpha-L-fucosidase
VGRDGNLLLNVGPRPDGQIDLPQAERLREIGAWLRRYGESIYATRGGPFLPSDYGVSTRRDKTIYVHVLKWPEGKLLLPAIPAKIVRASVLTGGEVSLTQTDGGIELFVPLAARKEMDTIIALQLDSPVNALQTVRWSR